MNDAMKLYVTDLEKGEFIQDQVFSIDEFQQHTTRSQNPYFRLILQDKTGEISANIWHDDFANCSMKGIEVGDVVKIDAEVIEYKGRLQLTVKKLHKTDEYDISDQLQASDKDIDGMLKQVQKYTDMIENNNLRTLFDNIFGDENFVNRYKRTPAAELIHHDFIGGLLEHTLEMLDMSGPFLKYYPEADTDLVIAGIVLHDIGKVYEQEVQKTAIVRTTKGRLIGHVVQGLELVKDYLPNDFPDELWMKLSHIIISHQGEIEYGSPVRPSLIEAAIVYVLDKASSHVRQFQKAINLGEGRDRGFSEYQKYIKTQVYLE